MDALDCLMTRRSSSRLGEPAPDDRALATLLAAATAAPDHGLLRPWRFVVVRGQALRELGEVFAAAHAEREPDAPPAVLEVTRRKPLRAPLIMAVISSPKPSPKIPVWEQTASAAAAAQNVCLAANALGFGSMWRTGWYGEAPRVRAHLGLAAGESVMAWIYLGTRLDGATFPARPPVEVSALTTVLGE
jgi:nitroreductase